MIKESDSIYAYKVEHIKNFSFQTMMSLARDFVRGLDGRQSDELYDQLNRGVDLLSTEPLMNMYLHAYGNMHEAKLKLAFNNMGEDYKQMNDFAIIDYGCGQGLASVVLYDHLKTLGIDEKVHKVVLIEPSENALKRAALHVSKAFPEAEIATVNKFLDDLMGEDITCENMMVFHLFSNILDVESISIEQLADLVNAGNSNNKNIICVSPNFGGLERNRRMDAFCHLLNADKLFVCNKIKGEWIKDWSCVVRIFAKRNYIFHETLTVEQFKERMNVSTISVKRNPQTKALYFESGEWIGDVHPGIPQKPLLSYVTKSNGESCWLLHDESLGSIETIASFDDRENFSTEVTEKDLEEGIIDELGVIYSKDGKRLLKGHWDLREFNIPKGTKIIYDRFIYCPFEPYFYNAESLLYYVSIPDSVIKVGKCSFYGCTALKKIELPNTVLSIGEEAFAGCMSLKEIILSNKIQIISTQSFYKCYSLETIRLPNSVNRIANYAFEGCTSLKSIYIPNSVNYIGEEAFCDCVSLESVFISDSVNDVGFNIFKGCNSLESIIVPFNSKVKFARLFYGYEELIVECDLTEAEFKQYIERHNINNTSDEVLPF